MNKEIFPFMLLSCELGHRRISALPSLLKAVASYNYSISSKSRVHPPSITPCIPPHKPPPYTPIMHHSPCLPDIHTSLLQAVLHGINPPAYQATTSTFPLHSALAHALCILSLLLIPNKPQRLPICTFLTLPYIKTGTNNECLIQPPSTENPSIYQISRDTCNYLLSHLFSYSIRHHLFPIYPKHTLGT